MSVPRARAAAWAAAALLLAARAAAQSGLEAARLDPDPAARAEAERRLVTEGAGLAPVEFAGPVDASVYRLGPGDVLHLYLWGRVSRTIPIVVGPEGSAFVPDEGPVPVAGRTLAAVRADLVGRMQRRFRDVKAELTLSRARTFRVYLTGQVRAPGPVSATGGYRVADVLPAAALLDDASRRRIELLHADGGREICDLDRFLRTGDGSWNPWLRDGDVLYVPTATEFVYAQGAVSRAGRYELGVADSLRTLLRLAGDPLPAADADRVLLVRFHDSFAPESLWTSLDEVLSGTVNPRLSDGERLYVYYIPQYRQQHEAVILGEVERPGVYPIVEGSTRLSDLTRAADGFRDWADLSAIRVHRRSLPTAERDPELERLLRLSRNELTATEYEVLRTKLAGLREDYRVDWARLMTNHELDVLLRDGDVVRVERLVSSIRVDGEVRRPGIVNFVSGAGLDTYLAQAGGFTNRAWRSKVRVTRAVTGQTLLARNVRSLHPGDLVWVPEKPDVTVWEQSREVLTALAQIATVVIAVRSVR